MYKNLIKKLYKSTVSLIVSMFIGFAAYGDDIEIYYGISDENQTVNPNVVFIFDTSGSMAETDGNNQSRMLRSKDALKRAISNISDVNVSLMRFSSKGGPVLMPAEDINARSDERLVVRSIYGYRDIAVDNSSNQVVTEFNSVGLTSNDENRRHALRFTDMQIPKNAIIESAHITYFKRSATDAEEEGVQFLYVGSTRNDPPPFVPGEDFRNLFNDSSNNLALTATACGQSGAVCWEPTFWSGGQIPINTPNLASVVQEVIDQSNWEQGDPILIFGQANNSTEGERYRIYSHSAPFSGGERLMAPQLRVKYRMPLLNTDNYKVKDKFISYLDEFVAAGGTPVVDTLYEAYLYLNAKSVNAGINRGNTGDRVSTMTRTSQEGTFEGSSINTPANCNLDAPSSLWCRFQALSNPGNAIYKSPIDEDLGQCQANYIVLFSDGAPNGTTESQAIANLTGTSCSGEACAEALAEYMATKPSERGTNNNDAQVFTYTVGFESDGFNDQYLRDLAAAGEGQFYSGNTTEQLADAFTAILIEAKKGASTFVAPGISVNQFNRLTHSNDIYYALFDPKATEYWPGNLKKYKLIDSVVLDKSSEAAIAADGFFKDTAHDWWSISGNITSPFVGRGGAAEQQTIPRNVYSNLSNPTMPLADNDPRITVDNLDIDNEPNENALRASMVDWIRGYDATDLDGDGVTNEPRYQMADPLHSEPLFFQYGNQASVYIGTNEGYLLSIDAETGQENWAFIPEDLLPNLHSYYENDNVFNTRTYGMDGSINAWKEDGRSYIVVGQRRGGRNYYVLDVTNRTQPIFKYMIEGGEGDFNELAQSWSKPTITKIEVNGVKKRVLVFGGGYDDEQDDNVFRNEDNDGASVFIVDASDGSKIAEIKDGGSHDVDGMKYSIPSRVAVIDKNFDGLMDHMYFGDMGGNLFRVDVYNGESLNNMFVGKKIYQTSKNFSVSKNRRFYYAPDVAEIVYKQEHYYAITIGSGYRAHPLNEDIDDSVLMLKDKGIFAKDENGLYTFPNITNVAQLSPETPTVEGVSAYDGYEFNLVRGEKVITGVSIINSKIVFSTYDPSTAGLIENTCSAAQGGGRIYVIDLLSGGALLDNDGDGDIDYDDTYVKLDKSGIPAEPRLIITDPDAPTLCIGTECADTIESDDDDSDFKRLLGTISGPNSRLNQIFTNSWSSEVEPTTKDDN